MSRRHFILIAVVTVGLLPVRTAAHDSYRIVGVVTERRDTTISVKSRDGKTTAIGVNKQTEVTRNKKKVDASELKVGASVVVDALGDSEDDLMAIEVQLVPPMDGKKK
jgi:hypothetical protein